MEQIGARLRLVDSAREGRATRDSSSTRRFPIVMSAPLMALRPHDPATAYAELIERVRASMDDGIEIPCVGPGAEAWTSEDVVLQDVAAERCGSCPLATQCRAYAETAGALAGIWGGKLFGPSSEERRRSIEREKAQVRALQRLGKSRIRPNIVPDYLHTFEWELGAGAPGTLLRSDTPMNAKATNLNACLCGCGGATRATFCAGHDAKMISNLVAVVVADSLTKAGIAKLAKSLPSDALRAKFERAAARATAPKPAPEAKADAEEVAA
ncbi:WhiB family transcriptional regulator [Microbacterium lacticum]|uniref:WhiB family transcriptional regulator n=1 Tax=Microbacterium lacticum TaxID=33885 RepID=UPI00114158EA|nr:WhiB family transcriptional regulator [Microbacterium lacticum]